jgi:hypothetical protein
LLGLKRCTRSGVIANNLLVLDQTSTTDMTQPAERMCGVAEADRQSHIEITPSACPPYQEK